jgi:hypothetical protein
MPAFRFFFFFFFFLQRMFAAGAGLFHLALPRPDAGKGPSSLKHARKGRKDRPYIPPACRPVGCFPPGCFEFHPRACFSRRLPVEVKTHIADVRGAASTDGHGQTVAS